MLVYDSMGCMSRIIRKGFLRKCCIGMSGMMLGYDFMGQMLRIVRKEMCCIGTAVNDIL